MGIALIAVVGLVSLNLSPSESWGCGGTEFSDAAPCSMAEFQMTMQEAEPLRLERKMCFRSLKAEGGCPLYDYNIVGLEEDDRDRGQRTPEHVQIRHGRGCETAHFEGILLDTDGEDPIEIAMKGTPSRAPIPVTDAPELLASGECRSSEYDRGRFELRVRPAPEAGL